MQRDMKRTMAVPKMEKGREGERKSSTDANEGFNEKVYKSKRSLGSDK